MQREAIHTSRMWPAVILIASCNIVAVLMILGGLDIGPSVSIDSAGWLQSGEEAIPVQPSTSPQVELE